MSEVSLDPPNKAGVAIMIQQVNGVEEKVMNGQDVGPEANSFSELDSYPEGYVPNLLLLTPPLIMLVEQLRRPSQNQQTSSHETAPSHHPRPTPTLRRQTHHIPHPPIPSLLER
jgi:hypothetical protein